jgi:large repetitive protein
VAASSLNGRVLNGTQGLNDVTVTLTAEDHTETTTTSTISGVTGSYSFTGLAPVTWSLTFSKATFAPLSREVTLGRGATVTSNASLVEQGASISGTVTGQASALVTATPLAGVLVTATKPAGGASGAVNRSMNVALIGGQYHYSFGDLPAGTYTISFTLAGYDTTQFTNVVLGAAQIVTQNATLTATARTVTITARDELSAAVPGVQYTLTNTAILTGTPGATATTDATGLATLTPVVPPGTYTLGVTTPAGYVRTSTATQLVVPLAPTSAAFTEAFQQVGAISGTVTADAGGGGGAVATNGVTVTLLTGAGAALVPPVSTTTAGAGTYTFSNVPIGTYQVRFTLTGYGTITATGVVVTRNVTTTQNGALLADGSISGTASLNIGGGGAVASAGVTVTVSGGGLAAPLTTTSGLAGAYTVANVPAANGYTVTFSSAGGTDAVVTGVNVTAGQAVINVNGTVTVP